MWSLSWQCPFKVWYLVFWICKGMHFRFLHFRLSLNSEFKKKKSKSNLPFWICILLVNATCQGHVLLPLCYCMSVRNKSLQSFYLALQPHVTSFIFNKLSLPSLSLSSHPLFLRRRHFNESVRAPFRTETKISIQRLNKFSPASLDVGLSSSVPFALLSASFLGPDCQVQASLQSLLFHRPPD